MLESLGEVDWTLLNDAYGAATDVPRLLQLLLSPDPLVRGASIGELINRVNHQGTVYPVSAAVVPVLYELLANPSVEDKPLIAFLIASIAVGDGGLARRLSHDFFRPTCLKILQDRGLSEEVALCREVEMEATIRRVVATRIDTLLPYLKDQNSHVRCFVAAALGRFPEFASQFVPALQDATLLEEDEEVQESLTLSIKKLWRGGPD